MLHRNRWWIVLVVAALLMSGCRPVVAQPDAQEAEKAALEVMDQFYKAYDDYDMDAMLALHTDNAVWTWIDEGKNFPDFGPEGKLVGPGKEAIGAMFTSDRGEGGFTGYPLWTSVEGDTVEAVELWNNDYGRAIDAPLIVRSTYTLREGKIADWVWSLAAESSRRMMNTADPLAANTELMASINDEIWTQFKLDQVTERYAENYVRHMTGGVPDIQGVDAFTQYLTALQTGFPDFRCTVEDALAAGDKVAVRYRCMGTQTGEWMGSPATGKPLDFSTTIIHQIADGKVVEDWVDYDSLGFMQQLGFELAPKQ